MGTADHSCLKLLWSSPSQQEMLLDLLILLILLLKPMDQWYGSVFLDTLFAELLALVSDAFNILFCLFWNCFCRAWRLFNCSRVSEERVWQPRNLRPEVPCGWKVHPCPQSCSENQVQNKLFRISSKWQKESKREGGTPKPVVGSINISIIALNEVLVKGAVHINFSLSPGFPGIISSVKLIWLQCIHRCSYSMDKVRVLFKCVTKSTVLGTKLALMGHDEIFVSTAEGPK